MAIKYFNAFPSQAKVGDLLQRNNCVLQYLGGDPKDKLSWKILSGVLRSDPDTTGWSASQTGASWMNMDDGTYRSWNGSQVVIGEVFDDEANEWRRLRQLLVASADAGATQVTLTAVLRKWASNLSTFFRRG